MPVINAPPRVLLVYAPFGALSSPSLGLSLLKSVLETEGIPCDIRYLNYDFLDMMPGDPLDRMSLFNRLSQRDHYSVGDWIFNGELFDAETVRTLDQRCRAFMLEHGASTEFIDLCVSLKSLVGTFLDRVMAEIPWPQYAVVGFHSIFNQTVAGLAIAARVRQQYPPLITLLGGPGVMGDMGRAVLQRFPQIDFVVQGEADRTIVRLVRSLARGEDITDVPGILYRTGASPAGAPAAVVANAPDLVPDLDQTPMPDFSDFFVRFNDRGYEEGIEVFLPIENARGCWWGAKHQCTFCGMNACTLEFRCKSATRALDEFRGQSERYGVRRFHCADSIMDLGYYETLLPMLRDSTLGLCVFYWIKPNVRREQMTRLAEAGVTLLQPGLEHLSSDVLRLMRKGTTYLQNVTFLKWAREENLVLFWSILYGFPGETREQYLEVADRIPRLFHLFPPKTCDRVRIDRFSPLFVDADAFGLTGIRPAGGYRHVFPYDEPELAQFAYRFEADDAVAALDRSTIAVLQSLVTTWNERFFGGRARLDMLVGPRELIIRDTRCDDRPTVYHLEGRARDVYLACDAGHTESWLNAHDAVSSGQRVPPRSAATAPRLVPDADVAAALREVVERGWPVVRGGHARDSQPVADVLRSLVEAGLMTSEGGSYLSLACQIANPAEFLGAGTPPSPLLPSMAATRGIMIIDV